MWEKAVNKGIVEMSIFKKNYWLSVIVIFSLIINVVMMYSQFVKAEEEKMADDDTIQSEDMLSTKQDEGYYQPEVKRDPFRPFLKIINKEEETGVSNQPPIKRYQLQEFRIAGIIWIEGSPKAMVIDPEGNTYYLSTGDQIGNRDGIILEIGNNGILVQEKRYSEDVFGKKKLEISKVVLAFREE